MSQITLKDRLRHHQGPTPGKAVTASNRFDGHDYRMASHASRVWNHACERTDGARCTDCIGRKDR